jgi:hypothetical protein
MYRYTSNASLPAGSTCSNILGRGRRFGVKNGIKSEDGVSSLEPSSAVNPMDYSRYICISVSRRRVRLTPLATLRLITASKPTKAPLSMNSTFDVSIWYMSGFAKEGVRCEWASCTGTYVVQDSHSVDLAAIVPHLEGNLDLQQQTLLRER